MNPPVPPARPPSVSRAAALLALGLAAGTAFAQGAPGAGQTLRIQINSDIRQRPRRPDPRLRRTVQATRWPIRHR